MKTVFAVTNRLVTLAMIVAGIAVVLMMLHVSLDVLTRPFLSRPLPGTTLIVSDYYMVACAFLPLAYAQAMDGHISMDALAHLAPRRTQYHMAGVALLIAVVVFALLTWTATHDALTKYRINSFSIEFGTRIPTWPSYFLLPAGCALMTLISALRLLEYALGRLAPPK
ncbi:MAG: C4-dicarboxylate ABC transporter substrate-binding protein [Rhodobacteraceae bacterium]|nr:C4-dicarboxylate ABC transporter substrate-binding protein [Paracoccaceae bacterium]MBR26312.1 C4-dicarboxylate ABC transporter substrate-binding protein [Paracoccaceae bacterium]